MAYQVTFIPGDGTGPEIAEATKRVLDATGVDFVWDVEEAGVDIMETAGTPLPDSVIESVKKNKVAIKGPITTPVGTGFRSVNVALRKALDLYACVRPCKSYPGVRSRYEDIDLVIVRENTEDLYAGIEFEKDDLYDEAARIVVQTGQASISYLQRKMRIGFSRAARLVDMMEAEGLVSAGTGGKPREVLVGREYFEEVDAQLR